MSSSNADFWNGRYAAGRMPWDQPEVPRAFVDFVRRAGPPGRAFVPGCGSGYELGLLHEAGWRPLGVDFSSEAVARARKLLGSAGDCIRCDDFFACPPKGETFDLVYERTFLCALPPSLWSAYGRRMAEVLRPGGRLCGFFFFGPEDEPPPYPIGPDELARLLGPSFERIEDAEVSDSLPLYAGKERWQVWRRR